MPNIVNEVKLDFKDVLLRPKRSNLKSRADVDLYREMTFRNSLKSYRGIPIIASNMDTVGTFEMALALSKHGLFTAVHKYYTADEWSDFAEAVRRGGAGGVENGSAADHADGQDNGHQEPASSVLGRVAASSGSADADCDRLDAVLGAVPELGFVCLDVANGYTGQFVDFVRRVREHHPDITIIAGNVVTGEMVEELVLSGADIVKVGIGPGSVCTTRQKTGVGYPQLSAVMECADAAHGLSAHIIADGGCSSPGDVAKAFGAGADFVMVGGLLAGHDQCAGQLITKPDGKKVKLFYGMSSETAMVKRSGGVASYRCSEGRTVEVAYRGDVAPTVLDLLGGLRSACTYTGAARLKELPKRATFIRCSQQQTNTMYS